MHTLTPLQRLNLKKQKQALKFRRSLKNKQYGVNGNPIRQANSISSLGSSFTDLIVGATIIDSIFDD